MDNIAKTNEPTNKIHHTIQVNRIINIITPIRSRGESLLAAINVTTSATNNAIKPPRDPVINVI